MNRLFIIGNVFDLAHNLKSSYWYFREYLRKYAENFLSEFEKMYGYYPVNEDDWHLGKNKKLLIKNRNEKVYKQLWQYIEYNLGYANESNMLDFSQSIIGELDLDGDLYGIEDTMNNYWKEQYEFVAELESYVNKWALQIRLNKVKPKCKEIFRNQEDFFLTFNYTNTLERIYEIPYSNILYIHGGVSGIDGSPVLGHGNTEVINKYRVMASKADEEFDEASKSIYNAIADFYERTFKNTEKIIFQKMSFFQKLENVNFVNIIGHSLGKVDMPYFKTVMNSINSNAEWNVYYYQNEEKDCLKDSLLFLGLSEEHIFLLPSSDFWDI